MNIILKEIAIADIVKGYINNNEDGVIGYDGKLNIRPKYQREFIYKDAQRDAVIDTIIKSFPLNVMYFGVNKNDTFEVIDGQQRLISICEYVSGCYSINFRYFHNLTQEEKEQILNYKLMVYFCDGTEKEKLEWFKTINIAGEKLTEQELRNAIYTGEWLSDAKRYFSKTNCPAYNMANEYMRGSTIRQDYLETVLAWISNDNIEDYMSKNQNNPNASELWLYFNEVVNWIKTTFPNYRKEMKGVNFGLLYTKSKGILLNSKNIELEIIKLMQDEDVTKKSGIYSYIITRNEKFLNIRAFSGNQKREAYERQNGICPMCDINKKYSIEEMEADHITPWSLGGKTISQNCQMLCKEHNRIKSNA